VEVLHLMSGGESDFVGFGHEIHGLEDVVHVDCGGVEASSGGE
jgi:hypothetical protein